MNLLAAPALEDSGLSTTGIIAVVTWILGFVMGVITEVLADHWIPAWQRKRDQRRAEKAERKNQWFEKGSERPEGPRPRPPAPQPTTQPIVGQKEPEGGRHARPRQREARFFTRQRRSKG